MTDPGNTPNMVHAQPLWTVKDMAYYLNISEWYVRELLRQPGFQGVIRVGRLIRIHPLTSLRWLEAQQQGNRPEGQR